MKNFKLCYIEDNAAYFTTQELDKQWGDDWNDAPYEHNAGTPYEGFGEESGKWEILKVFFDGPLETPAQLAGLNSRYSVQMINSGAIAWLTSPSYLTAKIYIPAGVSLQTFRELVYKAGGKVYVEFQNNS